MSVPEQTPYIEHTGNGVTTSFALKFQCESKDHLIVLVDDVEPPIASWSLTGGNVVFTTAPASGRKITLQRNTPFSRNTDYQSYNNSFRPPAVNKDFDWIWLKLQELGVADWILGARIEGVETTTAVNTTRLDTEITTRKQADTLETQARVQGDLDNRRYAEDLLAMGNIWDGISARSVWDNELGLNQQQINDTTIQKVASIAELIAYNPRKDSQVVNVLSYHPDKNVGGDLFMWRSDLSKSLHDGGYVIDPLIAMPSIATFNTYYSPKNTGTGVWVRQNNKQDVYAESYGIVKLSDDPTAVWSCAALQQAILKASVRSNTDYAPRTARIMSGRYYTTNPVVLTQVGTYSARLPSLIGGSGGNVYDVELIKTTQNTVGAGYTGGDKDAVIYVSAGVGAGKSVYVYGEHTSGFTLSRTTEDVGYGYFAQDSVMGYRGNIQTTGHGQNIWTDNCWMSKLGALRAYRGLNGIAIRGGTSNYGGPLYSDSCKHNGYDFYGLSYSELLTACDKCGSGLPNGGIAYDFSYAKAVKGTFAVEQHKGTEFYFHYSDGVKVSGRSYHTTPVQDSAYKVQVNGGSIYSFDNYTWQATYANTSVMTSAQIAKYTFTNKTPTSNSSANFKDCAFNNNFAKSGFVSQLEGQFMANVLDSIYTSQAGVVTHLLAVRDTVFKRLCYMGHSAAVELLSANSTNPTYGDRFYCNPFTLTEGTPNTIANPKPNRIAKSAISTNPAAPTILWYISQGGTITGAHLRGYIDADGWLCVQHSVAGNGIDYRFVLAV